MKLPRRTISASGRGRCRAAGRVARRLGASLSDAAGAHRCWLPARRRCGHHGAPDRSMALGAAWSAVHHRQPSGSRQQHRHRSGRARAADGYYAAHGRDLQRDQRDALRQAQFQFHPRHRAGRDHLLVPNVMVVHPSFPAKTILEFIAYSKTNPGKVNMGSGTPGAAMHMSGELFKIMAGVDMVHVPYRGAGPTLTDLLAGQVQVSFPTMPASIEHIRAGRLRALAVTTATRSDALPDIPTVGEFLPGYEASNWYGLGVPKATPAEIVDKLNKEVNAALDDPKMKARLADLGGTPLPGSPVQFGKLIAEETEKWGKVIRAANIKPQG